MASFLFQHLLLELSAQIIKLYQFSALKPGQPPRSDLNLYQKAKLLQKIIIDGIQIFLTRQWCKV